MKNIAKTKKIIKEKANAYTTSEAIDVLVARINEAYSNMDKAKVQPPPTVQPVTSKEINADYTGRKDIVEVDFTIFQELQELRAMNDMHEKTKKGV